MEMAAAELLSATAGGDWVAGHWVHIIKGLRLHPKAVLREGAEIGWAVRPDNPKLLATLNRAVADIARNVNGWSDHTLSCLARLKQIAHRDPRRHLQRFHETVEIFQRYAGQ
jgi:hypothetical protein